MEIRLNTGNAEIEIDNLLYLTDKEEITDVAKLKISNHIKYGDEEFNRIKSSIKQMVGNVLLLADRKYIAIANRLLWECPNLIATQVTDSKDAYEIEKTVTKTDKLLWDVQAEKAEEDVALMSGWTNSYNNQKFSDKEIEEYIEDSRLKLLPYLGKDKDVLEVGVGSGMIARRLLNMCKTYDGADISKNVLEKFTKYLEENEVENVSLYNYGGDEIQKIGKQYDIIFMSSVTEYFSGYNYLLDVIKNCVDCVKEKGIIFFADVFDLGRKEDYRASVYDYAQRHPGVIYKKNFSHELFIPRDFWEDASKLTDGIVNCVVTDKIGEIDNEINKFRYDVMIFVDKNRNDQVLNKYQFASEL